ncbi:MAG: hypothetical protein HGB12_17040 [Bacteroidetes bacterium]|nr:hypothetical protein [Bacteroidota bacterium]
MRSFLGYLSGHSNTTGTYNVAIGYDALYYNNTSIGADNTAIGVQALKYNTSGYQNTATGMRALYKNTSGTFNTASGNCALQDNTTGDYNTAFGYYSLNKNVSGNENTATGNYALRLNESGEQNCAYGTNALNDNLGGWQNTAIGYNALFSSNARGNTATGWSALYSNEDGENNTANGTYALRQNLSGSFNTALGEYAGSVYGNTTGTYNTFLGVHADASSNYTNATAIGYGATALGSDRIELGNAATSNNGVFTPGGLYSTGSDGRFKFNIKEEVKGLEFIMKLRPVTYNLNTKQLDDYFMQNMPDSIKVMHQDGMDFTASSNKIHSGFIAQEVEIAAQQVGYDFDAIHKPDNTNDIYSLAYGSFVVPIVKAVQELSKTIDSLKNHQLITDSLLTVLKNCCPEGSTHKNMQNNNTGQTETAINIELANNIILYQNEPNPFDESTVIRYFIPENITSSAYIVFTDFYGREIKKVEINERGFGKINVDAQNLTIGIYSYSLMVDGNVIDTKKMVKE